MISVLDRQVKIDQLCDGGAADVLNHVQSPNLAEDSSLVFIPSVS
jgi:hypothetical protein